MDVHDGRVFKEIDTGISQMETSAVSKNRKAQQSGCRAYESNVVDKIIGKICRFCGLAMNVPNPDNTGTTIVVNKTSLKKMLTRNHIQFDEKKPQSLEEGLKMLQQKALEREHDETTTAVEESRYVALFTSEGRISASQEGHDDGIAQASPGEKTAADDPSRLAEILPSDVNKPHQDAEEPTDLTDKKMQRSLSQSVVLGAVDSTTTGTEAQLSVIQPVEDTTADAHAVDDRAPDAAARSALPVPSPTNAQQTPTKEAEIDVVERALSPTTLVSIELVRSTAQNMNQVLDEIKEKEDQIPSQVRKLFTMASKLSVEAVQHANAAIRDVETGKENDARDHGTRARHLISMASNNFNAASLILSTEMPSDELLMRAKSSCEALREALNQAPFSAGSVKP